MRDVAPSTGRPTLDKPRARRDAAKVLAVALQARYRKLLSATGEDETVVATADLAQCMYENIEFVIWALKSQGGMNPPPPEQLRRISAPQPQPANDPRFAKPPKIVLENPVDAEQLYPRDLPCNCEPMQDLIIDRLKHASSCPKFVP